MQAAFVELGLERTGFLHASDLAVARPKLVEGVGLEDDDEEESNRGGGRNGRSRGAPRRRRPRRASEWAQPRIEENLKVGQEILVQVTKEPIGTKGPRITQQISLPGRYLVFMPNLDHLGISRRIVDRDERSRLRSVLTEVRPPDGGLIVRTVGEGRDVRHFRSDITYLEKLWGRVRSKMQRSRAPAVLHREMELTTGLIRDLFTDEVDRVIIDSKTEHKATIDYLRLYAPELKSRVEHYAEDEPIFDRFGIEAEIEKTFDRKIWLKRGGYIIIDHTEAMVTIDVNTGRFTGKDNQEDTILRTNLSAAREVARQVRLRDIGGIIVTDFIDMEVEANKRALLEELRGHLRRDRARTKVFEVSELGLIEMTRQRVRPSLLHFFSEDCPACEGRGKVLSLESVAVSTERLLKRAARELSDTHFELYVAPEVAAFLKEQRAERIHRVERGYDIKVKIIADDHLRREERRLKVASTREDVTDKVTV